MAPRQDSQYRKIFQNISGRIAAGEFKPGAMLPSEAALCGDFAASRPTIRRALKLLEQSHMAESLPGKGWQVLNSDDKVFKQMKQPVAFISKMAPSTVVNDLFRVLSGLFLEQKIDFRFLPLNLDIGGAEKKIEQDMEDFIRQYKPGGLIVFSDSPYMGGLCRKFMPGNIKVVNIGLEAQTAYDTVCGDNFRNGRTLVNHLVKECGHCHVAFATTEYLDKTLPSFRSRRLGYEAAMAAHRLKPHSIVLPNDFTIRPGMADFLCKELLPKKYPTTVLIGAASGTALSVALLLMRRKCHFPEDLSLCGFGLTENEAAVLQNANIHFDFKKFTCVDENWTVVASVAGQRLLSRIRGDETSPGLILVPGKISPGDSVRILHFSRRRK